MFRSARASLTGSVLLLSACVGSPASAPLPADADPAELRAASLQQDCRGTLDQMDCYSERLLQVLEEEGVTNAMLTLEALGTRDRGVQREGHMYAHHIGLAASPSPDEVGETFRACRPSFQSGCYHGVIQSYFAGLTSAGADVDAGAMNALCGDYRESAEDRWLLFQCVHGLGHGLTMLHGYHLPTALESCDLLGDDWDREGCYGGVFMESIMNATAPHHTIGRPRAEGGAATHAHGAAGPDEGAHAAHEANGAQGGHQPKPGGAHTAHARAAQGETQHAHAGGHASAAEREPFPALDPADPLYPCTALDDRYLVACYQMQTSAILARNGGDIQATARACDRAPEQYRGQCYLSLGRDISGITLQNDERARRGCSLGDTEYAVWCHIGYVKNLVDLTADPTDALAYCGAAEGEELKQACYHAVGEEIWVLTSSRERGEEWCAMAEDGHREACRRGAGLASWRDLEAE